jgi:hypothetical protein
MQMKFERVNAFTDSHFPADWNENDLEALAEFVNCETDYRLVETMHPEEFEYELHRKVDDE